MMETCNILLSSIILTQAVKSTAVYLRWFYFPPLAFEDDTGVSIFDRDIVW